MPELDDARGARDSAASLPTATGKPVILAVDDDPQVLAAIARDLRRHYGERFRVVRAADGASAIATLEQLTLAATPLALIVTDQRMPNIAGIDVLMQARAS